VTIKKFIFSCLLASTPMLGMAEAVQESLIAPTASVAPLIHPLQLDSTKLALSSGHSLIMDLSTNSPVYAKDEKAVVPIASITKLMTAMVVLDAKLPMDEVLTITEADKDWLKNTHSRMRVGTQLSRYELMRLALMSSENRAAAALGRNYPGGLNGFIRAMNAKAQSLGMNRTRFQDSTGLSSGNVSTAEDLVKMVKAAAAYPEIHQFTTTSEHVMQAEKPRYSLGYHNTNALVHGGQWDIKVSKTGFTDEAGRCLVMLVNIANRPMAMVFLDAVGKRTPVGDATRTRRWIEGETGIMVADTGIQKKRSKPRLIGDTTQTKRKATASRKQSKPMVVAKASSKPEVKTAAKTSGGAVKSTSQKASAGKNSVSSKAPQTTTVASKPLDKKKTIAKNSSANNLAKTN